MSDEDSWVSQWARFRERARCEFVGLATRRRAVVVRVALAPACVGFVVVVEAVAREEESREGSREPFGRRANLREVKKRSPKRLLKADKAGGAGKREKTKKRRPKKTKTEVFQRARDEDARVF